MKVVIVGTGNVATVMGKVIHNSGHQIVQIIGRNEDRAKELAKNFNCTSGNIVSQKYEEADIYILAITDTALYHLDQYIQLGNKLVVHTAGSVSKEVLKNISANYGIIYPLQSLVKDFTVHPDIPFLIDGNNIENKTFIAEFCNTFSSNISYADDSERLKYHVAAVLVNNFTNHLFAMAEEFCIIEDIEFDKLYPLIDETINRLKIHSPQKLQTGPAIREDIYTLGKHLQILSSHPELKYLYLKLSESILKLHQKK